MEPLELNGAGRLVPISPPVAPLGIPGQPPPPHPSSYGSRGHSHPFREGPGASSLRVHEEDCHSLPPPQALAGRGWTPAFWGALDSAGELSPHWLLEQGASSLLTGERGGPALLTWEVSTFLTPSTQRRRGTWARGPVPAADGRVPAACVVQGPRMTPVRGGGRSSHSLQSQAEALRISALGAAGLLLGPRLWSLGHPAPASSSPRNPRA